MQIPGFITYVSFINNELYHAVHTVTRTHKHTRTHTHTHTHTPAAHLISLFFFLKKGTRLKMNLKNVIFVFSALNYTYWYDLF